jgi:2-(1,2-epoxy-1,2-dihydrophenyl)acetyl-CoA isomerase
LEEARANDSVRAVVLTGAGKGFSAGQDLESIRGEYADGGTPDFKRLLADHHHRVVDGIRELPKPVIAAVNGVAAGAGLSFACACDMRIASDAARFTTAFTRIGLVPDGGLAFTLPRLVGMGRAMELFLLSDMVSAEEALQIGLVNRMVPHAELMNETHSLATRLAAGPTVAYGLVKTLLKEVMLGRREDVFENLLEMEANKQETAGKTEDHRRAVEAFLKKEQPTFSGR